MFPPESAARDKTLVVVRPLVTEVHVVPAPAQEAHSKTPEGVPAQILPDKSVVRAWMFVAPIVLAVQVAPPVNLNTPFEAVPAQRLPAASTAKAWTDTGEVALGLVPPDRNAENCVHVAPLSVLRNTPKVLVPA